MIKFRILIVLFIFSCGTKKVIINSGKMAKDYNNLDLVILSQEEKNVLEGLSESKTPAHALHYIVASIDGMHNLVNHPN